jgi:type I restriction enzyme M protein
MACDKASLDIFWLRDEPLENSDNLPEPGVIACDMIFATWRRPWNSCR